MCEIHLNTLKKSGAGVIPNIGRSPKIYLSRNKPSKYKCLGGLNNELTKLIMSQRRWRQYVPAKRWYLPRPHDVTTQKTNIDIFTTVRTSNLMR
jgi:hypothetical protein